MPSFLALPRILAGWILWFALLLLVLLALYQLAGRTGIGYIGAFREDLAELISEQSGVRVSIVDMGGRWQAFDPIIVLKGVMIETGAATSSVSGTAVNQALVLDSLEVHPAVLQSVLQQRLVVKELRLGSLVLDLGLLATLQAGDELPDDADLTNNLDWLEEIGRLAIPKLSFNEILIRLPEPVVKDTFWRLSDLVIRKDGYHFVGGGTIRDQRGESALASLRMDIELAEGLAGLTGDVYLEWLSGNFLLPLNTFLEPYAIRLNDALSTGRLWLSLRQGKLQEVTADISLEALQWQKKSVVQIPLDRLGVRLQGELDSDQRWQVLADSIKLQWGEGPAMSTRMQFNADQDGAVLAWERLDAGLLSGLVLATGLGSDGLQDSLRRYAPRGFIDNGHVRLATVSEEFQLTANVTDFAVTAVDGIPGGRNVNGWLSLSSKEGRVVFSGKEPFLYFPQLYSKGWLFEYGEGSVRWVLHDDATYVAGEALRFINPDQLPGQLRGDFSLWIPDEPGTANDFELSLGVAEASSKLAASFIPDLVVNPAFTAWMTASVKGGTIKTGGYQYAGLIGTAAPADANVSQMYFDIENGRLQYHPQWPALDDFSSLIRVRNGEMTATVSSGRLGVSRISSPATITLTQSGEKALLNIAVSHTLRQDDLNYWLGETVLREETGAAFDGWLVSGNNRLSLDVTLPLSDESPPRTALTLDLRKASLRLSDPELHCDSLEGLLHYRSDSGVKGTVIGQCQDQSASVELQTLSWKSGQERIKVSADAKVGSTALLTRINQPLLSGIVQGDTSGRLEFILPLRGGEHNLSITSSLQGLGINLPQPFGKVAGASVPVAISASWTDDVADSDWTVDWPGLLRMKFRLQNGAFQQGLLGFGGISSPEYLSEGLWIEGSIPTLDSDQWSSLFRDLQARGAGPAGTPASRPLQVPPWFGGATVTIGELKVADYAFRNTRLGIMPLEDFLQVLIDNDQSIEGEIRLPFEEGVLPVARFDRLFIPETMVSREGTMRPSDIPEAKADILDLRLGNRRLGHWSWVAEGRADGVTFNDLVGRVQGGRFKARLSWVEDPATNQQTTILTGGITGSEFHTFYEQWSGSPAPLTSEVFSFDSGVVWSGGPADFAWKNLHGQIGFSMERGSFRQVGPGADIFRIFGILNTDAITRRLKLDFSDLYEQGLAYDKLEGRARIQEGVVSFDSPLAIQAPSSAFKLTGSTSLVDDSLDMRMVVVLPVTQNLPLAALLVGAPQVGGALFLIDKLLGDPLSRLTSATYRIGGTLQEPAVSLEQIFENNQPQQPARKEQ